MAEEKIEKGVISEEALEEIAGGLKISGYEISKDTLKKVAIGSGVTVIGLAGLAGIGYGGKKLYDHYKESPATPATPADEGDDYELSFSSVNKI